LNQSRILLLTGNVETSFERRNTIASDVTRRGNQQRVKNQPVNEKGESRSPRVASSTDGKC
jgi:hypothetical protein